MKNLLKIFGWIFGVIGILLLALFIFLAINSPGKVRPFLDEDGNKVPGSVALIEQVDINGVEQGMIIRGRDTTLPVMLYLHGGPGSPEFSFVRQFNSQIEDQFIVCYWEQRGACISYSENISPETMTLEQFVEDAAEVSRYLAKKFNREKIYLLGHSWGSLLGSYTAFKYPDLYYAWIATGQVALQAEAEKISYDFVMNRAVELNDKKAIATLTEIGRPPYPAGDDAINKVMKERKYVTKYGGAVKHGKFYPAAVKSLLYCKEYSLRDKWNYMKGMSFTMKYMWNPVMENDLFRDIPSQAIPVYILQGTNDYQTAYSIALDYFNALEAPVKEFFPFEESAHSPVFEEPEKFEKILEKIVADTYPPLQK